MMKNLTVILASLALFTTVSCKDKQVEPATVIEKKETVVIEKEVQTPKAENKVEENDGTSISVGKNGVEFSTKDGDKKTKIEVKDGSGSIILEK